LIPGLPEPRNGKIRSVNLFEPTPESPKPIECPTCGTPDEHGEDFCFECGHAFTHGRVSAEDAREPHGETCPICDYGEIEDLSYGVRQCDRCGYTVRDWVAENVN
jgi:hypothetical protein